MDQVGVEVIASQVRDRLAARFLHRIVFVVPNFGSDPKILTTQSAVEEPLKPFADAVFIAVNRGAIKMPVSRRNRGFDCFRDSFGSDTIGAERTEPNSGNLSTGVKDPFRDKAGSTPSAGLVEEPSRSGFIRFVVCYSKR